MTPWRLGDPPPDLVERERLELAALTFLRFAEDGGAVRLTASGLLEFVKPIAWPFSCAWESAYASRVMREVLSRARLERERSEIRVVKAQVAAESGEVRLAGLAARLRVTPTADAPRVLLAVVFDVGHHARDVRLRAELARLGSAIRGGTRLRIDDYQRATPRALARAWLALREGGPMAAAAAL